MFIVKVKDGVYEVRKRDKARPIFRGSISDCSEFIRINQGI